SVMSCGNSAAVSSAAGYALGTGYPDYPMVQVQVTFSVSEAPLLIAANVARDSNVPAVAASHTPASVFACVACPAAQSPTNVRTFPALVLDVSATRTSPVIVVSPTAGATVPVPTPM